MINRIVINNYRCLREVSVDLKPLTVLIGPNDSGKSTFLRAVDCLSRKGATYSERDAWRNEAACTVAVAADGASVRWEPNEGGRKARHLVVEPDERNWPVDRFSPLLNVSLNNARGIPMTSDGVPDGQMPPSFGSDGSQVPSLLDYLLRTSRKGKFDGIERELRDLIPGMESFDIRTPDAAKRRLDVITDNGVHVFGDDLSIGVRIVIFYASLGYHPIEPAIITIEEPENGLHPKRLGEVMQLLRGLTHPSEGRKGSQVILTTHSPYLLDHVDLDTDAVLVCQRQENGDRTIEAAERSRLDTFLPEFMLGEVWFNEGEEGLLPRRSS